MNFTHREWITDTVTGAITGAMAGAVGSAFVPEPPLMLAVAAGGLGGLVVGAANLPVRWLLNRRPIEEDENDS